MPAKGSQVQQAALSPLPGRAPRRSAPQPVRLGPRSHLAAGNKGSRGPRYDLTADPAPAISRQTPVGVSPPQAAPLPAPGPPTRPGKPAGERRAALGPARPGPSPPPTVLHDRGRGTIFTAAAGSTCDSAVPPG
ncbi:hypothetical protein NDU88_001428 [Pleurodeles waltl]|uniref:Uncharacterized protein n=1 Tax=Pleurodeles waltl TaxID=8319 RepID=A0AAV7SBK8_PLEWA|nr:hypothetical protein NDU88_001428 [Pleurodeles waltl]